MTPAGARRRRIGLVAIVAALALGSSGCGEEETIVERAEDVPGTQFEKGDDVVVSGEVVQVLSANAFTMGADRTLVFSTGHNDAEPGDYVRVVGAVHRLSAEELAKRLGKQVSPAEVAEYAPELAVKASLVMIVVEGHE